MTVTYAAFIADYHEFSDENQYPQSDYTYWFNVATLMLLPCQNRWGLSATPPNPPSTSLYDVGIELFIAHNLVFEKMAVDAAANNAPPGLTTGPISSKGIGPLRQTYDTQSGIESGAGHWNVTKYGMRLMRLVSILGAGPLQINIGQNPVGDLNDPGWPGPYPYPAPGGTGFSS